MTRSYQYHQDEARSEVLQPTRKGAFGALVDALAARFQVYEDILFDVALDATVELGSDEGLRTWGLILREPRGALTASEHRRILRAAWRARRGPRTIETLLSILRELIEEPNEVTLTTPEPATVLLTLARADRLSDAFRRRVVGVMSLAVARGVKIEIRTAVAGGFRFGDVDAPVVVGTPFADVDTPAVTGTPFSDRW